MRTLLTLITTLTFMGCSRDAAQESGTMNAEPHVKVSVLNSGKILVDGTEADLPQLQQRLVKLRSEGGAVWYHRESGQEEPPPQSMQVIQLVIDNGLPISLSSKPDFSDVIGEDGQPRPRK